MIQVLIVDDQEEIIRGIRSGIEWEQLPEIDQVYHALSAVEAKAIFRSQSIDLLITDIEMPVENGLELVSWVNQNYPQTACILLTAHAEFTYAQDAVRLHCIDYILQPVQYHILQQAIGKAVVQILKDRELQGNLHIGTYWGAHRMELEQDTWRSFLSGQDYDLSKLYDRLNSQDIHLPLGEGFGLVIAYHSPHREGLEQWSQQTAIQEVTGNILAYLSPYSGYQCVFQNGENRFSLLFTSGLPKEENFDLLQAFSAINQGSLSLYFNYGDHLSELPQMYQALEDDFAQVLVPKPGIFYQGTLEREAVGELPSTRSWCTHFENRTAHFIVESIQECVQRNIGKGTMNRTTLSALQQVFLYEFQESLRKRALSFREIIADNNIQTAFSLSLRSVSEFLEFVHQIVEKNKLLPLKGDSPTEDTVTLAQLFIADHLANSELTRQEIAKAAHVSESHLSHLFTKQLGLSITDYINAERLKLAKSLLADTSMPIALIAVKSGYNSASYFISRFRKSTGSTPAEFRKQTRSS